MTKRIVVCFDGTWNKPGENGDETDVETNVCRIYESLLETSHQDGWKQISWYDRGVGTRFFERLRGGALGRGLDMNIKQGYAYLSKLYDDGDQIFVFGFSRGAYTGRSLVGLIRKCGLLRTNALPAADLENRGRDEIEDVLDDLIEETIIDQAYDIYRKRDDKADTEEAERFRRENGREVVIKFLGVWDTVGALGVPLLTFEGFNKRKYEFHDTKLSKIVESAYHAVAIDEHRDLYDVALWEPDEAVDPPRKVEQRWFSGAHSDVGGGYKDRWLSDASLRWMQERAAEAGLGIETTRIPTLTDDNFRAPITDSYRKFVGPVYRKVHPRHYRAIGRSRYGNEVIDDSVRRRFELIESYRPPNLDLGSA
jgi:uncharacterized protein (DUF2235 family)